MHGQTPQPHKAPNSAGERRQRLAPYVISDRRRAGREKDANQITREVTRLGSDQPRRNF